MNEDCVDCDEVLAEIQLFVDGEVTSDRAATVSEHLRSCHPCMQRAEFQVRLKEILRDKCRTQVPDHLVVRIRRIIRPGLEPRA
jgi:anti-sigma factor (TIGR02949 family)